MRTFDYIIIGGGTAGCVVAARLSADRNCTVLLLEAADRSSFWSTMPLAFRHAIYRSGLTWPLISEPEPALDGRRTPLLAGKALGGSSTINGMVYVRGQPSDFDGWAAPGAFGWDAESTRPWFERVEQQWQLHTVVDARLLQDEYISALSAAGFKCVADPLHGAVDGFFAPPELNGRRMGSCKRQVRGVRLCSALVPITRRNCFCFRASALPRNSNHMVFRCRWICQAWGRASAITQW